jgi:hypothetical protein
LLVLVVAIVAPMVVFDLLAFGLGVASRDGMGDDYRRTVVP